MKKSRVDVDDPDYDYLRYGFWLARTKNADGTVKSYDEVETFANSSIAASQLALPLSRAGRTYTGGATGVYREERAQSR